MILLIDNYDSFVHNLSRYLCELGQSTVVVRNDQLTTDDVRAMQPDGIVISPGPCSPLEAGVSMAVVAELAPTIPMLGVCLGHQAIAAALGGRVIRSSVPVHGKTAIIQHDGTRLFSDIPSPFRAARYHSLVIEEASLPDDLEIVARTLDGVPMAIAHRRYPLYGVQFHPESILTEFGHRLLANFLRLAGQHPIVPDRTDLPPSVIPEDEDAFARRHLPLYW